VEVKYSQQPFLALAKAKWLHWQQFPSLAQRKTFEGGARNGSSKGRDRWKAVWGVGIEYSQEPFLALAY
jgi:hypothetical protein